MLVPIILIFILGLAVGSFINVLIDRNSTDESIIFGKSHCDNCKKNIAWYDLIPVLSFIFLFGKCRYCKSRLSLYYPTVELSTGILFVATFYFLPSTSYFLLSILYSLFIVASLISIFFIDLKYGIIPDKIVYPAIAVSFLYLLYAMPYTLYSHLLSALGAFVFFLILFLVTRGRGMGVGDIKLAFLMGLILGFPEIVVALYLAFLTGAVAGVILILWRKKKLRGSTIPFGPFLVLGTILSLFYSDFFIKLLMFQAF